MKRATGERLCGNCDAFTANMKINPKPGEGHQGWCRAKAPAVVSFTAQTLQGTQTGAMGAWPTTDSLQWCRDDWRAMEDDDGRTADA
jgi:hypothetical protein